MQLPTLILLRYNTDTMIRKATPQDAEAIATYLLLAMEGIVYQFIGQRNWEEAMTFMQHFTAREHNQYAYQNCWVAEADGKVVGAVNVYNGGDLHELRAPVINHILTHYHFSFLPEDETGPGEYYIDTIGVHPEYRGRGIGARLLQHLVDEFVNRRGETLGLLVAEGNPQAKRLYTKLGFKPVGKRVVFGIPMEHLQINNHIRVHSSTL